MSLFSISQKKSASRTTRSARLRSLALETLEARELLSVSQADYEAIRGLYSEFNLPASMGNLNVAEMVATNSSTFNLTTLKSLIDAAAASDGDDLIVVRANDTRNTLTYTDTNNDLTINIPSGKGTLTIVAYEEGSSRSLTLNANMKSRCLTVKSGEVQLGNVFMKNGYTTTGGSAVIIGKSSTYEFGTGGGINNSGTLTTKNVTVSNCNASCKASLDSLYLNTIFSLGAGIYNTGSMSMYASTVTGNKAESSGATLLESTLNGIGGGIYNEGGSMSLYTCSVTGNIAQSDQWETTTTDGETTETIVIQQMGQTGGLYNAGGTVHITSSTVANNTAYMDAGIYNDATQDKTPVGGEMEIIDSVISGHSSQEGAGGIHNNARCTLTITASFIQGNSTKEWGGGIQTLGALTLVNSVVSGNTAVANGGGISVTGDFIAKVPVFEVNIVNTTITGNKVTGDTSSDPQVKGRGAGLYFCGQSEKGTFAQAIVSNSIIVDNLLADASSEDSNIYRDGTGSLTGNNNLSTFTGWTAGTGNNTYNSSIPLFVRNYNFNTRAEGDYQLLTAENSQVINKGSNVLAAAVGLNESSKDVNKSSRINEKTIDIGAYECQGRIVPPEPLDPPSNVTAQTRTATSITVTWSLVEYAYGYKLEYKQYDEETWTPYTGTITMGSMSVSCTITGLVQDKDYSFHVKASGDGIEHADSTQWSEEATAKTHVDTLIVATELDTSDNDDSILSLREAVALAGTSGWGTQIVFASALNGATISLTSDLTIARSITIDAGSLSRGVTLEKYSLIVETGTTAEITQVNIAKVTHTSLVTGAVQVKGTLILNSSQIVDNVTRGIYVDGGNISLYNCIVEKNVPQSQVSWGGGIRANNATVSLIDCVIRQNGDNALIGNGGGIFALDSSVWISGSLIGQNKSSCGGGIYFQGSEKTLSILSSSVTGNGSFGAASGNSSGGGIYLASGKLKVSNSLIAGNMVNVNGQNDLGGSAIYCKETGGFSLVNSTVTGNRVVSYSYAEGIQINAASIVVEETVSPVLANSIVAGNYITFTSNLPLIADLNCVSTVVGKNTMTTTAYSNWSEDSVNNFVSTAENLFTQVGQWSADNIYLGGNYNLLPTACAINTGNDDLAVDPEGNVLQLDLEDNARKVNTVDIGAFEAPVATAPRAVIIAPETAMEGCVIFLDASDSVVQSGSEISKYLWDLDGDGNFGETPKEQKMSLLFDLGRYGKRNYTYDGTQYTCTIGLKVENADGIQSLPVYHTVALSSLNVSLEAVVQSVSNEIPLAKLSATASLASGNHVCTWMVDWGDGRQSTYNALTNRISMAHYYSTLGAYSIMVRLIDTDGLGRSSWFLAGTYSAASYSAASASNANAATDMVFAESDELLQEDIPVEEIAQAYCSNDSSTNNASVDGDLLVLTNEISRRNKIFLGAFIQ